MTIEYVEREYYQQMEHKEVQPPILHAQWREKVNSYNNIGDVGG